jgi:hypothetical protein
MSTQPPAEPAAAAQTAVQAPTAAPAGPVVDHAFYAAAVAARDRAPVAAMLHTSPELYEKKLPVEEWDALLVEFLQSTPE